MESVHLHLNDLFKHTQGGRVRDDGAQDEIADELWNKYLEEMEVLQKPSMDAWREDSNGVIVLAALFSAIVGVFIIESYKQLSPDTGKQTVVLLRQISQQLADSSNGSNPKPPSGDQDQAFSPSTSILWVNGIWLTSLVLSITSALYSTLLQEWARTHTQIPQLPMKLSDRARVTSFLSFGLKRYNMTFTTLTAQALLHISVFCFFTGLVIFFFTINRTMAIVVLIPLIFFGLAYFVLTILRWVDPKCPCHTPMTWVLGYPLYVPLSFAALCLRWVVKRMGGHPISCDLSEVTQSGQRKPVEWLKICHRAVENCRHLFNYHPVSTLISRAKEATVDVDRKALTQIFVLLSPADESKTSSLVACIPKEKMVELVRPIRESGEIIFKQPILTVLRSCADGTVTRTAGLDEAVRKRSVLACLHAVHYMARSISRDREPSSHVMSLLCDVRADFANLSLMQAMWNDSNVSIRVTSRAICALLANCLLHRRSLAGQSLEALELDWLCGVIGAPSVAAPDTATLVQMNIKAFVYGVLLHRDQQCALATEHACCFTETLLILMNAGTQVPFDKSIFQTQLYALIARIQQDDPNGSGEVVDKLCHIFRDFLPHLDRDPEWDLDSNPIPGAFGPAPTAILAPVPQAGPARALTPVSY